MKILQIIPTLDCGGAEHFVCEISNELCQKGHEVDILTLFNVQMDNPLRQVLDKRIRVYSFNKKKGFEPRFFYSLWRFINRRKYDVVHGHVSAIKYMILASIMCKKVRFVATIHSEASREAGKYIDKWARWLMFRNNICIPVTISEESELSFEQFYGRKAAIIYNGVSDFVRKQKIELHDNDEQIVFIHAARCVPVKNQQLLFSAFNRLLDKGYNAKMVWVGNNDSNYFLFNSLKPLMKRNFSLLGVVDNVRDYMMAADAMCLSSKLEGMPMTIIEAFSVGCPVLCTPVGGCINMISQGENGMMSASLTIDSYYKMLESFVVMSREERKRMSAQALAYLEKYTIKNCAEKYMKLYGI